MNLKKTGILLIALLMCLALCACKPASSTQTSSPTLEPTEEVTPLPEATANENVAKNTPKPTATPKATTKSGYLLRVDLSTQRVVAFKSDDSGNYTIPVRTMVCTTGAGGKTPTGKFKISSKYRWKILKGNVWGQYSCRFNGSILFHSVPYYAPKQDRLSVNMYNQLGRAASSGCVRLTTVDAKWIYSNCPSGTVVEVVRKANFKGIPAPIMPKKLTKDVTWDPTDPDPKNPFKNWTPASTATPKPTQKPSASPTVKPSVSPSATPTATPSATPTTTPTVVPSATPTQSTPPSQSPDGGNEA